MCEKNEATLLKCVNGKLTAMVQDAAVKLRFVPTLSRELDS